MSRAVTTSSTDQSIRVWAYNSSGAAITGEAYNSAGIAVSVVVRSAGRIVSTTALTLVARSGAGVHTDSAFTEVGAGEYVVDLPDSYSATAGRQVSVTLTSTAISGGYVLSETLDVGVKAELDSATQLQLISIEEDSAASVGYLTTLVGRLTANAATAIQNLYHMITGTGASSKYTVAALENAPAGGGGSGDATLAKQEEILAAIEDLADIQLAAVEVDVGTITGFPETLIIGDSYSEDTGQIRINITDSVTGDPIDSLGTLEFANADVAFTAFRPNDSARITGICEYVREPSSGTLTASYVLVTLLTSETAKGKAEYTYEGRLKFVWQGPSSSDETDEEQKTYKTTPFKFIANP